MYNIYVFVNKLSLQENPAGELLALKLSIKAENMETAREILSEKVKHPENWLSHKMKEREDSNE